MAFSPKFLAGPAYYNLNTIRYLNIICFLAVISASVVMVVKTVMVSQVSADILLVTALLTKDSQFYFFDGACHIITCFLSSTCLRPFFCTQHLA